MKIFLFLFIFYSAFIFVLSIIPNWNLDKIGKELFNISKGKITYTILERDSDGLHLTMTREFYLENNTIQYKNYIDINNNKKSVSFDYIESFYNIKDHIIICPKGAFHPFDFTEGKEITDTGFEKRGLKEWDLKCRKHPTYKDNIKVFIVFYLMNNNSAIFYRIIGEDKWGGNFDKFAKELYDFKLSNNLYNGQKGEFPIMSLIKNEESVLTLQGRILYFKDNKYYYTPGGASKVDIIKTKTYTQAYFNLDTNSYYYISYDDVDNFISGYYITQNKDISYKGFDNWYPTKNNITPFEFLEAEVEIEEMNFILYNNFVYYKIRSKKENNKLYHGILDIRNNKIIFNTNETLYKFIPNKDISMLAITPSKVYEICFYKDAEGNCKSICDNNKYKLDIDNNICTEDNTCSNDKLMLIPNEVCIETCDESIYIKNSTHCGLCRDFGIIGKEYKLINGTECIEYNKNTMDYFNEKLKLLKCKNNYRLINNDCVPNCYKLCEDIKCSKPSINESNQYCTECKQNYFLFQENCNENCPQRHQADNTTKTCIECNDTNCNTFINNTCKCTHCKNEYFLNSSNICESCPNNCSKCNNSTTCEECINDHFINSQGVCTPCPNNCSIKEDDNCQCKVCDKGYFKNIDTCQKCDDNCQSCSLNETNCTSCEIGKFLTTENKCLNCDEKCLTCDSNENNVNNICLSCNKTSAYKYLVNDDSDKTCVENCTEVGREFNEDYTCKSKKNETEKKEEENKSNSGSNKLLLILGIVFGVILLVILIIIIKICWCDKKKQKGINSDELNTKLNEVNALTIN